MFYEDAFDRAWTIYKCPFFSISDQEDSNSEGNDELRQTKLIVTLGVLIAAFVLSLVIAKLVDICYDKRAIREDASDISDNTRNLIRARLSVIQFKKREKRKPEGHSEKKAKNSAVVEFFRRWTQKVRDQRKQTQESAIKAPAQPGDRSVVITIDKTDSTLKESTVDTYNNNSASRSPRLPLFSGGKMPPGSPKPQSSIFTTRPISARKAPPPLPFANSVGRNSVISLDRSRPVSGKSMNDKFRPVSSKPRDLPNVTRVDVDDSPKVHVKTVHFDNRSIDTPDLTETPIVLNLKPKDVIHKPEVEQNEVQVFKQEPEVVIQVPDKSKSEIEVLSVENIDT